MCYLKIRLYTCLDLDVVIPTLNLCITIRFFGLCFVSYTITREVYFIFSSFVISYNHLQSCHQQDLTPSPYTYSCLFFVFRPEDTTVITTVTGEVYRMTTVV